MEKVKAYTLFTKSSTKTASVNPFTPVTGAGMNTRWRLKNTRTIRVSRLSVKRNLKKMVNSDHWCPCGQGKSLFFLKMILMDGKKYCVYRCRKCHKDYLTEPRKHNERPTDSVVKKGKQGFWEKKK